MIAQHWSEQVKIRRNNVKELWIFRLFDSNLTTEFFYVSATERGLALSLRNMALPLFIKDARFSSNID